MCSNTIYHTTNLSIPETKRCGTCKSVKPVTDFYNNREHPDGKATQCKSCKLASNTKSRNNTKLVSPFILITPPNTAQCETCLIIKPLTSFARSSTKSGHRANCKECCNTYTQEERKIIRHQHIAAAKLASKNLVLASKSITPTGHKNCSKCKECLPYDKFYKDSGSSSGYSAACRVCHNICTPSYPVVTTGTKQCNTCGLILDINCFHIQRKNVDGRYSKCKGCRIDSPLVMTGNKECLSCHQTYDVNIFDLDRTSTDGRAVICPTCAEVQLMPKSAILAYRNQLRKTINMGLVRAATKHSSTISSTLGCSYSEYRQHLEQNFLPGMSWDNRQDFHIDHIVPESLALTREEVKLLNHHTNLRPLWIQDNLDKSNTITDEVLQHPIYTQLLKLRSENGVVETPTTFKEIVPEGYKYCPCCTEVLAVTEFNSNKSTNDNLANYCKICWKSKTVKYTAIPINRIVAGIRNKISDVCKNLNVTNTVDIYTVLGCTKDHFKHHLESTFLPGMTWDNYPDWVVNRVVPICFASNADEIALLSHYTNFRVLWATDPLVRNILVTDSVANHPIYKQLMVSRARLP
jgi:hypothetical protein